MPHEEMLQEYREQKKQALAMGGPEKLARRRDSGLMNARERIDYLLDEGTFMESGLYAKSARTEVRHKSAADGKIAGYGRINGREVALVSNDFTVLGASSSINNLKKMGKMKEVSIQRRIPLILLGESTGARMPDRMGASGRATMGSNPAEYQRLREAPMISALLGECYGSSTWYSCISDFAVMRKGAHMAVASSRVTAIAINQPVDPEELGGWRLHSEVTGLVDRVAENDEEALDEIKKFLTYMPSHSGEEPPPAPVPPGSEGRGDKILDIIPESTRQGYDVRDIIETIMDLDSLYELKPNFGTPLVTALCRLNGRSVGVVANNTKFMGGAISVDAMRKATSFLVLCDSFNIPLIFIVDQPGFLIGVDGERRCAPGRIMNWLNALSLCTVPKLTVIMRKDYGQAYLNMCGGRVADEVILWPTADLGFMDATVGVNVLYGLRREEDPERFDKLRAEIQRDTSAWDLAIPYAGHHVIDPRETRDVLRRLLDVHLANGAIGQHHICNWPTSY